jgi:restriction endonuclease Mrr
LPGSRELAAPGGAWRPTAAWSLTHLSQAGLIERPVRAQVKIPSAGLDVVRTHPDRVDVSVLRDYPAYREFRERSRAKHPANSAAADMRDSGEKSSPADLIGAAVAARRLKARSSRRHSPCLPQALKTW